MNKVFLILLCLGFLFSCSPKVKENQTPEEFVASLPQVTPEKIVQFNSLDSLYLQYLSTNSIVLENGNFLLGDKQAKRLYVVDKTGKLVKVLGRIGRGPGEFLDVTLRPAKAGGIIVFDDDNDKAVIFDSNLKFKREFIITPFKNRTLITGVYPGTNKSEYILTIMSYAFLLNKETEPYIYIVNYNSKTQRYSNATRYNGIRRGGGVIPYYPSQQFWYSPDTDSYFLFFTGSNIIAEVNANLDTLRTIKIDIPSQKVNEAEMESIREANDNPRGKKIISLVPEYKPPADSLFMDEKGRFWLKLNYRGKTNKWVVLNKDGIPQKIVNLPDGMVTHISIHHIGVRLNENTFALFEPVK